jgi:hypothetical protein
VKLLLVVGYGSTRDTLSAKVRQILDTGLSGGERAMAIQATMQSSWRWCVNCQGLWFAGLGPQASRCPSPNAPSGQHVLQPPAGVSGRYVLACDAFPPVSKDDYQQNWAKCDKCQALFYNGKDPGIAPGVCPADHNPHDATGSPNYVLSAGQATAPQDQGTWTAVSAKSQSGWYWCRKCLVLFWGNSKVPSRNGVCPADGGAHDATTADGKYASGNYTLSLGPFPERLNIVFQNPSDQTPYMVSSPDGTLANLFPLQAALREPIFGPGVTTGSAIGVTQSGQRFYFACLPNVGANSPCSVNIGSVGVDGSVSAPTAVPGCQSWISGDGFSNGPAVAWCNGKLYLYFMMPSSSGSRPLYGSAMVVPDVVGGAAPIVLDNSALDAGRMTAAVGVGAPWGSWSQKGGTGNGSYLPVYWGSSSQAPQAPRFLGLERATTLTGSLFTLPNGHLAVCCAGQGANPPNNGVGYWYVDATSPPASDSAILLQGSPGNYNEVAAATAADKSAVYFASVVNNALAIYKYAPDLASAPVDSGQITVAPTIAPSILCCGAGGLPVPPG